MGQQPNIELTPDVLPRPEPAPPAPRSWRPKRPGEITTPAAVPSGPAFGRPGPDTGFALRLIRLADLSERSPQLEAVLAAIMAARASWFGRAPMPEDLNVALALLGLDPELPEAAKVALTDRRRRWLKAVSHEKVAGRTALSEIEPSELRLALPDLRRRLSERAE